jgi:alkylhydroperoxidase family enzyme
VYGHAHQGCRPRRREPGPTEPRGGLAGGDGFTDAERAALELAEQGTRIADAAGGVSDEVWANAAKHFDQDQLGSLVATIALINAFTRVNVVTRQPAGEYRPGQWK